MGVRVKHHSKIIYKLNPESIETIIDGQIYRELKYIAKTYLMYIKRSFLLRILIPLLLLYDIIWSSYGRLSGFKSDFESCT